MKRIEDFSVAVHSEVISLESGNYYFSSKDVNSTGNIIVTLSHKGENLHKMNWIQLEATLRSFLPNCDSEEHVTYSTLIAFLAGYKAEFPSSLRNQLNYTAESSIFDLEKSIPYIDLDNVNAKFMTGLLKLKLEKSYQSQMEATAYLASFIFKFNMALYAEYLSRSNFGKDFQKERKQYFRDNKLILPS